jgi:hypothetical protein
MDLQECFLVPESASQNIQSTESSSGEEEEDAAEAPGSPLLGRQTSLLLLPASPLLTRRKRGRTPPDALAARSLRPRRILDILQPDEEELTLQQISCESEPSCLSRILQNLLDSSRGSEEGGGNGRSMDQISIKTPNPKCRLFLKIDQKRYLAAGFYLAPDPLPPPPPLHTV